MKKFELAGSSPTGVQIKLSDVISVFRRLPAPNAPLSEADVEKGEDATTLTDKECYVKCVKTDMSELDCKKACYADWAKEDKCKTCYEKCG